MNIVEKVKNFVEEECKKPTSHYGYEPFEYHFEPMVRYARQLARKFDRDEELIELAAWLHDVGSIMHGRKDHHKTGAKIAEEKLREFGYPEEKIEVVSKCILNHRGSKHGERESVEEQIIAEADAMSNFDNISGIFKAAFVYENKNQGEARKSVKDKLERKWQQLYFEESKEIIGPKFEAVKLLLG